MPEDYVSRHEHNEFVKRIEDENNRQNHRIGLLEESMQQIHSIALSVKELAVNMAGMQEEMKKQGERLGRIEAEPADTWKTLKRTVLTVAVTAIVTALLTALITHM